jgi:hypothetical protein
MEPETPEESAGTTWLVVLFCIGIVLLQGFFAFFHVGDKGPPDWDYRTVPDVPGQSPYAVYETLPYGQHVRGEKGE